MTLLCTCGAAILSANEIHSPGCRRRRVANFFRLPAPTYADVVARRRFYGEKMEEQKVKNGFVSEFTVWHVDGGKSESASMC